VTPDASVVATGDQLSTDFGNEVVILGLRDSVYYGLEEAGARVWQLLQVRRTIAEIVDVLVAEYDVPRDRADADVRALVADLQTRGLVAITPADRP
jgi:hypothetical protein